LISIEQSLLGIGDETHGLAKSYPAHAHVASRSSL